MRNKIAESREKKRLTQEELASLARISRPYLCDVENGKYNPGGKLMLKIARALEMSVEDIFFEEDVMPTIHDIDATP